jgi:putative aldouronate transport system substrate-binding protein
MEATEAPSSEMDEVEVPEEEEIVEEIEEQIVNEPLYFMDPTVEMSVIKSADTFFGYFEGQTPGDNAVYDMWEETMGIRFVNKVETAMEGYEQQVRLAIASDDLPDVIAASAGEFEEMIRNDMLVDLKPYIDQYMDPVVRDKLMAWDGALFAPVARGDAIYGLPATSNVEGALRTMWIRKDWLEAVGRDVPTTMEEVIDLAIAFTEEDPDGNGEDDTWGLPVEKNLLHRLLNTYEMVANACGYYPGRLIEGEDGNTTYGSLDPGLKDVLEIFQDLYARGAIDPEFTSKDFTETDADVAAGKYGLWLGVFWKPVDPGMQTTYQEGVEWIAAPIPPCEDLGVYKPFVALPATAWYGVRKDYEHPEALIVAVNNYLDPNGMAKPDSFQKKGLQLGTQPEFQGIPLNNWAALQWQDPLFFSSSSLVRALNDPDFDPENPQYQVHLSAYMIVSGEGNPEPWQQVQFSDIFIESIGIHEEYPPENYVFTSYVGAPTETMQAQGSILEDLETTTLVDIVTGNSDVMAYDDFIQEYLQLGGEQILEEVNQQ